MLTTREVASQLGLSESAVRKIPAADLPPYHLGPRRGAVRYRERDVTAYLDACCYRGADQAEDEPLQFVSLARAPR